MSLAKYAFHRLVVLALLVLVSGFGLGQVAATLQGHTNSVYSVAFSPDGKTLASGSYDKTIKLWDVASGRNTATLQGHTNSVYSVAFSPDGKKLASGSDDSTIKLWDVASGRNTATLQGHTNSVYSVAFSPDGKTLASGSDDGTIKLWDVASGRNTATLQGYTNSVYSVAFSPDGKKLASGDSDGNTKLWDIASGRNTATLQGHANSVFSAAFSPDGKTLASGSDDGTIKLWDVASGRNTATLQGNTNSVYSVAFSPDGKKLTSGDSDGNTKLWDIASGRNTATLQGHSLGVYSVAFSPDGKIMASGSLDKTIKLWDTFTAIDYTDKVSGEFLQAQQVLRKFSQTAIQVDGITYLRSDAAPDWLSFSVDPDQAFHGIDTPVLLSTASTEEITRSGDYQPHMYVPLAELPALSGKGSYAAGTFILEFIHTHTISNGQTLIFHDFLSISSSTTAKAYKYQELLALHKKNLAAVETYQRNQKLAALQNEEADSRRRLAEEAKSFQEYLNVWAQSAILVDGQAYIAAKVDTWDSQSDVFNEQFLALRSTTNMVQGSKGQMKVFSGAGQAVLYTELSREQILAGYRYLPVAYIPLKRLADLGSGVSFSVGKVQIAFARQVNRSDGKPISLSQTISAQLPENPPKFTYQQLVDRHKSALTAVATYQKAEAERTAKAEKERKAALHRAAVVRRNPQAIANFTAQIKKLKIALKGLASSLIWVDGVPYFAYTSSARALGLEVKGGKVVGPSGTVSIMMGKGSAVKYSSKTVQEVTDYGEYSPTIYIPFDKLPRLNKATSWDGKALLVAYKVEKKVEDMTFSQFVYTGRLTGGKTFTYPQITQRHHSLLQAQVEYRKNEAKAAAEAKVQERLQESYRQNVINSALSAIGAPASARETAVYLKDKYGFATRRGVAMWDSGNYPQICHYRLPDEYVIYSYDMNFYSYTFIPVLITWTNIGQVTFMLVEGRDDCRVVPNYN